VTTEGIDLLGKCFGVMKEISELTHKAMNGNVKFQDAMAERLELMAEHGMTKEKLEDCVEKEGKPDVEDLSQLLGRPWQFKLRIKNAALKVRASQSYVSYVFPNESGDLERFATDVCGLPTMTPEFHYEHVHYIPKVTQVEEERSGEDDVSLDSDPAVAYAWIGVLGAVSWLVAVFGLEADLVLTSLVILGLCAVPVTLIRRKAGGSPESKASEPRKDSVEKDKELELKEMEERLGKGHVDTLPLLEDLRSIFFEQGNYRKALSFCNRGLECCEKKYGKTSAEAKQWLAKTTEADRLYRMS